jgi:alkaline phosphatase D
MKTRRSFINTALAASTAPLLPSARAAGAQPDAKSTAGGQNRPERPLDLNAVHRGSAEIDQRILALSAPPQAVGDFFAEARTIFDAHPMAAFADLPALGAAAARHTLPLLGGPMLGALAHDSARVWVRTIKPAQVEVLVQTPSGERRCGPVASSTASDLSAVVPVTGLSPAARHPYRVLVDGKTIPLPASAAIITPPAPDRPGRTTIAFGSCFHKTGLGNRALLERMRLRGACAALILGDSAVDDRDERVGLHRCDYLLRDLHTGWRELAAGAAIYAAWDDHDYFNNDKGGVPPGHTAADRDALRRVWTQNWNNPAYGIEEHGLGIFFRTRLGPCDLIMLDTRSRRTRRGDPDAFLGSEQMRWLERELAACTGPFVVITGGTMWSDTISNGKDSWGVWDRPGRERIFSLVEKLRLPAVFLSGDRHGARVVTIPRPSGHLFWEFEPASLGAHKGPPAFGASKELQPFGMTERALYGECEFDTTAADPAATFRIVDAQGEAHWQRTFTRSELTPPECNAMERPLCERQATNLD